ncbi:CU044_2847 family protein [Kitasatospora sp. MAP5-34]|uniref:CU044_2847 family protein n=1 Tax=Kitasatospora sp. MAP5-34 TaxID=3035102 RepID=UPI002472F3A1|nr:CU044_2847 family protein [Kitasatospora sp. MAP5-34]MDH6576167.1 hypothetical protein [Kitasatospora sp. MAP5-34]
MSDYIEFSFDDGSSVMLRTFPAPREQQPEAPQPEARPAEAPYPQAPIGALPPGLGGARPVGRRAGEEEGGREPAKVTKLAQDALRNALRPLVPLLQEVHETIASVPYRPHEVSVEFGVQFGSDLKLGIVSGSGEASLTISATWQLPPRTTAASEDPVAGVALPQAR